MGLLVHSWPLLTSSLCTHMYSIWACITTITSLKRNTASPQCQRWQWIRRPAWGSGQCWWACHVADRMFLSVPYECVTNWSFYYRLKVVVCYYSTHVWSLVWACALSCVIVRNSPRVEGGEETFFFSFLSFFSFLFLHINTVITMLSSKFVVNHLIVLMLYYYLHMLP